MFHLFDLSHMDTTPSHLSFERTLIFLYYVKWGKLVSTDQNITITEAKHQTMVSESLISTLLRLLSRKVGDSTSEKVAVRSNPAPKIFSCDKTSSRDFIIHAQARMDLHPEIIITRRNSHLLFQQTSFEYQVFNHTAKPYLNFTRIKMNKNLSPSSHKITKINQCTTLIYTYTLSDGCIKSTTS